MASAADRVLHDGLPGPIFPEGRRLLSDVEQNEYDRNLVIFWDAVGYAQIGPNYQSVRQGLREVVGQNPGWVNDRERAFVQQYCGANPAACPSTPESAEIINALLANARLQEALFWKVDRLGVYRPGIRQPMTMVVGEISAFKNVRMLEFGNDQLNRQPVDLRRLTNLRIVDIRDCGLRPEDLVVSRRVSAMVRGNDHYQILPDNLPSWMSASTFLTTALTKYRGENSPLSARIGFTICYFGLLCASVVETLARGVFSILLSPIMLAAYAIDARNAGNDLFDMTVVGTVGSAINILACGHALYANLATQRAISYARLAFGLSHRRIVG